MTILVDSDILIEVSRGRDAVILAQWLALSESGEPVLYSPVTEAELWAGVRPGEQRALEDLFGQLVCIAIDAAVGRRAGELMRQYGKSHAVELADALIAASALSRGAALWTRNRKHYPMHGLRFL